MMNNSAETAEKGRGLNFEDYISDENSFSARIPSDWEKNEDIIFGRQVKEYGVDLRGPANKEGAYVAVSATYFGSDHEVFKTHEKYIAANLKSSNQAMGEKTGKVRTIAVAGRTASQFDRNTFISAPLHSVDAKRVKIFQRKIVVPAKKGFYVLTYQAPMDLAKKYLKIFDAVLNSFKPRF
ncbi:MAG: hypothetical protein HY746_08500 [Elusimicrobia bacterium]|nr:hypothetical protein [Elusimicrobiota bacterium]